MAWPKVVERERGVEIAANTGRILVDASAGSLVVEAPASGVWELGASRAGIGQVLALARDELSMPLGSDETRVLFDAVMGVLKRASDAAGVSALVRAVEDIRPTPLVYSAPFLDAPYLRRDAERFRACRVAIARIEDDGDVDATPERAAALVDALGRWRDVLAFAGKARRALNLTLSRFGDAASAYALWGLRGVPLSQPLESVTHLEVLGCLGAHPRAQRLKGHMALVEAADIAVLNKNLQRAARLHMPGLDPPHALAELVAAVPSARNIKNLEVLVAIALDWWSAQYPDETQTTLPPIPLPRINGIRFLETFGDVVTEGKKMRHCVGTRRVDALAGKAFLFHVGTAQHGGATIQVDDNGVVVEARGPKNTETPSVRWGTQKLNAWGRGFWAVRIGLEARVALCPEVAALPGSEVLQTVRDCLLEYQRGCAFMEDSDHALERWWIAHVERARRGELVLVAHRTGELPYLGNEGGRWPHVEAVSPAGKVLADTNELLRERGVVATHPAP